MFGIVLFFVGAVLFVNGMATLGKADAKGAVPVNLFVGSITLIINIYFMLARPFGEPLSFYYAATGMLFSLTYLWNAANSAFDLDGRALGWFCLFVGISAIPTAYISLESDWRFAAFWATWGALWLLYFVILALGRTGAGLVKFTGQFTIFTAIATCWVPGYIILIGHW